jgi:PIN domain nuclease of toxin-antitoxin system
MLEDSPKLSREARAMMTTPGVECFVSAVSFWEIAIKAALRRDDFRVEVRHLIKAAETAGLKFLLFSPEHAVRISRLPKHHADPFDRALIAQAMAEPLTLLTGDAALARYGDFVAVA